MNRLLLIAIMIIHSLANGTTLQQAAEQGSVPLIEQLLKSGSEIDGWDRYGNTALSRAIVFNNEGVVKFLLSQGANIEARSRAGGNTALMGAANWGRKNIVLFLLGKNANINATNDAGKTVVQSVSPWDKGTIELIKEWSIKNQVKILNPRDQEILDGKEPGSYELQYRAFPYLSSDTSQNELLTAKIKQLINTETMARLSGKMLIEPDEKHLVEITRFLTNEDFGLERSEKAQDIAQKIQVLKILSNLGYVGGAPNNKRLDKLISDSFHMGIAASQTREAQKQGFLAFMAYELLRDFSPLEALPSFIEFKKKGFSETAEQIKAYLWNISGMGRKDLLILARKDALNDQGKLQVSPIVAVVDNGFDLKSPSLKKWVTQTYNPYLKQTDASGDERHGTKVASLIAQYNPQGSILAIKSNQVVLADIAAFDYLSTIDHIKVISVSLSIETGDPIVGGRSHRNTIIESLQRLVNSGDGKLVVIAAGNDGGVIGEGSCYKFDLLCKYASMAKFVRSPELKNRVIIVGAAPIDEEIVKADPTALEVFNKSNKPGLVADNYICAPGLDIVIGLGSDGSLLTGSGTSIATPAVSGLLARLIQEYGLTVDEARDIVFKTASKTDPSICGNGIINIDAAIAAVAAQKHKVAPKGAQEGKAN